jgi:hypothetical protein
MHVSTLQNLRFAYHDSPSSGRQQNSLRAHWKARGHPKIEERRSGINKGDLRYCIVAVVQSAADILVALIPCTELLFEILHLSRAKGAPFTIFARFGLDSPSYLLHDRPKCSLNRNIAALHLTCPAAANHIMRN